MNTKKIAIIGTGKVSHALKNGFVNHGKYLSDNILVVGKNHSKGKDPSLKNYEHIVLAVRPDNAIDLLVSLKGRISPSAIITSFVSGLNITILGKILRLPYHQIVKATLNTNVAFGCGIICFKAVSNSAESTMQNIFTNLVHPQGLISVSAKDVNKGITLYGSMNAFDAKFIKFLYYRKSKNISFKKFVRTISLKDEIVKNYLHAKEIACSRVFGFSVCNNAQLSFESTLYAIRKNCNNVTDIDAHIKTVVTPNGCTEKGLGDLKTIEDMLSFEKMRSALDKIYRKSRTFGRDIYKTFKKTLINESTNHAEKVPDFYCRRPW